MRDKTIKTWVVLTVLLFLLLIPFSIENRINLLSIFSIGGSEFEFDSCETIDEAGTYYLTEDLSEVNFNNWGCINITVSNVELDCNGHLISAVHITDSTKAIISTGENTTIRNCNILLNETMSSEEGNIVLNGANNSLLINNAIYYGIIGVSISYAYNVSINNNSLFGSSTYGISVLESENVSISYNNLTEIMYGYAVYISRSKNSQIIGNNISENYLGIYLEHSSDNYISSNKVNSNILRGIDLQGGDSNTTLISNEISYNNHGLGAFGIDYPTNKTYIINNNITNNRFSGISITRSPNSYVSGNTISNNSYNFGIEGISDSDFNQTILTDNLIDNNKKIYYSTYLNNYKFDSSNAGDGSVFVCASCVNVSYENLNASSKNFYGFLFFNTTNSSISNSTSENNAIGIYLQESSNNSIEGNNLSYLYGSTHYANSWVSGAGIYLDNSNSNVINKNYIKNAEFGVSPLNYNSNNRIFNNTIRNVIQTGINTNFQGDNNRVENNEILYNLAGYSSTMSNLLYYIDQKRVYKQGELVTLLVYAKEINLSILDDYSMNATAYPYETVNVEKSGENFTLSFNATKEGIYTLKIKLISNTLNNSETRNIKFIVGENHQITEKYFFRGTDPQEGQPKSYSSRDSGSLLQISSNGEETRTCGDWVQYQIDFIKTPIYFIEDINTALWVKSYDGHLFLEQFATYQPYGGHSVLNLDVSAEDYSLVNESLYSVNISQDSIYSNYWLSIKLDTTDSEPIVINDETRQGYAELKHIYSGPYIQYISEEYGSDFRDLEIMSSTYDNSELINSTIEFEGNGFFGFVINDSNINSAKLNGISCTSLNLLCKLNSISEGLINITLGLSSLGKDVLSLTYEAPSQESSSSSSGSSSGSSGSSASSYIPSTKPDALENNVITIKNEELSDGYLIDVSKFAYYNLILPEINEPLEIFNMSSEEIRIYFISEYFLKKGENLSLDTNKDGEYDLLISYDEVNAISLKSIKKNKEIISEDTEEKENYKKIGIWAIFLISIGVISIIIILSIKSRKSPTKKNI